MSEGRKVFLHKFKIRFFLLFIPWQVGRSKGWALAYANDGSAGTRAWLPYIAKNYKWIIFYSTILLYPTEEMRVYCNLSDLKID